MLELLKTLYVFQSLDLALFFFLRGRDVLVVVWPGVGDGDGDGRGGRRGGRAIRRWIVSVFTPPSVAPPPSAKMAFYRLSMLLLPVKGYFFVDEKDTPPGLKRNPSIHKVV